jgi:hypothetical protein
MSFPGTHFYGAESTPGHMVPSVASEKIPGDTTGDILNMEGASFSEILPVILLPTRHQIPKDSNTQSNDNSHSSNGEVMQQYSETLAAPERLENPNHRTF